MYYTALTYAILKLSFSKRRLGRCHPVFEIYHREKSNVLIKKIETLVSKYDAQKLQRQVFVSGRIKTMNESIYYTVDAIHNAISENKKIKFQYYQWNVRRKRTDGKDVSLDVVVEQMKIKIKQAILYVMVKYKGKK